MIDRKTFVIGLLTLSAGILTIGHIQLIPTARADEAVSSDDYQLVTGRTNKGDEAVYVLQKQNNLVAIFTWDTGKRSVVVRDVKNLDAVMTGE